MCVCVCVYSTVLLYMYGKRSRVQLYRQSIHCSSTGRQHCTVHKCVFVLSLPSSLLSSPTYIADTVPYHCSVLYSALCIKPSAAHPVIKLESLVLCSTVYTHSLSTCRFNLFVVQLMYTYLAIGWVAPLHVQQKKWALCQYCTVVDAGQAWARCEPIF